MGAHDEKTVHASVSQNENTTNVIIFLSISIAVFALLFLLLLFSFSIPFTASTGKGQPSARYFVPPHIKPSSKERSKLRNWCYPVGVDGYEGDTAIPEIHCIPNNYIIGVVKGATSYIFGTFAQAHPKVRGGVVKEVKFYEVPNLYVQGIEHFASQYPNVQKRTGQEVSWIGPNSTMMLDASPLHQFHPEEMYTMLGKNTKMILSIRNPISRAVSHYNYAQDIMTREVKLKFEEAIYLEHDILIHCFPGQYYETPYDFGEDFEHTPFFQNFKDALATNDTVYLTANRIYYLGFTETSQYDCEGYFSGRLWTGYLSAGLYQRILHHIYEFFPTDSLLVITQEDLRAYGQYSVLDKLCEFLDLETFSQINATTNIDSVIFGEKNSQEGREEDGYVDYEITESMNEWMKRFYRDENAKLFHLLQRDLGWND